MQGKQRAGRPCNVSAQPSPDGRLPVRPPSFVELPFPAGGSTAYGADNPLAAP